MSLTLKDTVNMMTNSDCPRSVYDMQLRAMNNYMIALEVRAVMENVKLKNILNQY